MAIDRNSRVVADNFNNTASLDERREPHRDPAMESEVSGYDLEKTEESGRWMSRVGDNSTAGTTNIDEDSVVS
ncbi:MAG: hypothetical protein Q9192_008397, partial [Flavoplaca navasiana]